MAWNRRSITVAPPCSAASASPPWFAHQVVPVDTVCPLRRPTRRGRRATHAPWSFAAPSVPRGSARRGRSARGAPSAFGAHALRHGGELLVELLVGDLDGLRLGHGPQGQIGLDARRAWMRSSSSSSSSVRPVAPRNWPMLMPWASRRWLRSWMRSRTSSSTSCRGSPRSTSSTSEPPPLLLQRHLRVRDLVLAAAARRRPSRSSPRWRTRWSRPPTRRRRRAGASPSRLSRAPERDGPPRTPAGSPSNGRMSPAFAPRSWSSSSGPPARRCPPRRGSPRRRATSSSPLGGDGPRMSMVTWSPSIAGRSTTTSSASVARNRSTWASTPRRSPPGTAA